MGIHKPRCLGLHLFQSFWLEWFEIPLKTWTKGAVFITTGLWQNLQKKPYRSVTSTVGRETNESIKNIYCHVGCSPLILMHYDLWELISDLPGSHRHVMTWPIAKHLYFYQNTSKEYIDKHVWKSFPDFLKFCKFLQLCSTPVSVEKCHPTSRML